MISIMDLVTCGLYGDKEMDRIIDFYITLSESGMYNGSKWIEEKANHYYSKAKNQIDEEQMLAVVTRIDDLLGDDEK